MARALGVDDVGAQEIHGVRGLARDLRRAKVKLVCPPQGRARSGHHRDIGVESDDLTVLEEQIVVREQRAILRLVAHLVVDVVDLLDGGADIRRIISRRAHCARARNQSGGRSEDEMTSLHGGRILSLRYDRRSSVFWSGQSSKYFSSSRSNADPCGKASANKVLHDRSFMSSGKLNTSEAERPSRVLSASTHSTNRGPRTAWAR